MTDWNHVMEQTPAQTTFMMSSEDYPDGEAQLSQEF